MDPERRQHLYDIIANAGRAHKKWVEHGDSTIIPEDDIYQRFQEVADQATVINRRVAEPLEMQILAFAPYWQAFVSAQQVNADATMLPSDELWAAWEAMARQVTEAKKPKLKTIETVAKLVEQKVPPAQICLIYGFMDENNHHDFQKLQEEIDKPGTHTGAGFVHPVNRQLAAQIKQIEIEQESLNRRRAAKVAAATTPAAESIEKLVADRCSASQIAKMKRVTVEDVYEYCERHGLPRPPYDYTVELQQRPAFAPDISPERQADIDRLGTNVSPQFMPPAPAPALGPPLDLGGPPPDDEPDELPTGVDLSDLPPEEANQIQEAVRYYTDGMDVRQIGALMGNLHGNKIRALLQKGGIDLSPAGTAG